METGNLVIDTTIFIDHLRAKNKTATTLYNIPDHFILYLSTVTLYELYIGATSEEKKKDIELLTNDLIVLDFNESIALKSSDIYHELRIKNQLIEFRDIFIAATCLVYGFPLKTLNTRHFNRIEGLELL